MIFRRSSTTVKTMSEVAAMEAAVSARHTPAAIRASALAGVRTYATTAYPTASLAETP